MSHSSKFFLIGQIFFNGTSYLVDLLKVSLKKGFLREVSIFDHRF